MQASRDVIETTEATGHRSTVTGHVRMEDMVHFWMIYYQKLWISWMVCLWKHGSIEFDDRHGDFPAGHRLPWGVDRKWMFLGNPNQNGNMNQIFILHLLRDEYVYNHIYIYVYLNIYTYIHTYISKYIYIYDDEHPSHFNVCLYMDI
jgi:hypothetical protein